MNGLDLFDSIAVSSLFLPYWKVVGKFLFFNLPALCLGVVAFAISNKPHKGGAAMNVTEKRIDWIDYLVAHPFFIPLWVWMLPYMFMTLSPIGFVGVAFSLLFFAFWLRLYLTSATRLFEYCATEESRPAPSALLVEVKP